MKTEVAATEARKRSLFFISKEIIIRTFFFLLFSLHGTVKGSEILRAREWIREKVECGAQNRGKGSGILRVKEKVIQYSE